MSHLAPSNAEPIPLAATRSHCKARNALRSSMVELSECHSFLTPIFPDPNFRFPDFSPSHCQRRLGYGRIGPAGGLFVLPQWEGDRVSLHLNELATKIATLDPAEQEALWEKVAELNFQRGLEALAQKYRARLAAEGMLDQTADTVMAKLKKLREEIAANDYRT